MYKRYLCSEYDDYNFGWHVLYGNYELRPILAGGGTRCPCHCTTIPIPIYHQYNHVIGQKEILFSSFPTLLLHCTYLTMRRLFRVKKDAAGGNNKLRADTANSILSLQEGTVTLEKQ